MAAIMVNKLSLVLIILLFSAQISAATVTYEGIVIYENDHPTPALYLLKLKLALASMTYTSISRAWFGGGNWDPCNNGQGYKQTDYQANFPKLYNQYGMQCAFGYGLYLQFRKSDGSESGLWSTSSENDLRKALDASGFDYNQVSILTPPPTPTPTPSPTPTPTPACNSGYTYNGTRCIPSILPQGNQPPVKTVLSIVQGIIGWLQDIFSQNVCAQVATTAQNPATSEVKSFNTPCDVPVGWIIQ